MNQIGSLAATVTTAMRDMLGDCHYREQKELAPCLNYSTSTSKRLVDIGFFKAVKVVGKDGKAAVAFYVTSEGKHFLEVINQR
jgi:hypothetical protein